MSHRLLDGLRARGLLLPDYAGRGLANVPATVTHILGAWREGDLPALADLDPALRDGVRAVVVVLADGLGAGQLERLVAGGEMPFIASVLERARRGDAAQLLEITSVFPSTTAAAIATMNTARTPQEHGNLAYFCWLEEFGQVAQMLRWGPATARRGSFFDDRRNDPARHVRVSSIHRRLREHGAVSYLIEPEHFRREAMSRMHASEAEFVGYVLPTTMGVRLRQLLEATPWQDRPVYAYAYWAGIDTAGHLYGPRGPEHALEASAFDRVLAHALSGRPARDVLVVVTADHGHALVDPERAIDLEGDRELRALLRAPVAGEPRLAFLHTDQRDRVCDHLEGRWAGAFTFIDRDEAIDAGLFGVGDASLARRRVGEVCAMLTDDRAATVVRVEGRDFYHRGAHGGMTHDEMRVPVLAWRV
ncbi:MAG: alkaline phosphatase family protein [Candidatus Limnocylindria bacterium]